MTPRRAAVAPRWAELDPRLRALWDAAVALARERASSAATDLVGVGGATVELERAAAELGPGLTWRPLPRDSLLGATVWVLAPGGDPAPGADSEPAFVLLEPDTEGALAASLARHGEGLAAIYLRASAWPDAARGSRTGAGPFGRARLLPGHRWGPHVVVVRPRDTIGP